jgi:tRNA-dihydrouridine synthase C
MLGRGIVTDPGLALAIAAAAPGHEQVSVNPVTSHASVSWEMLFPLIVDFWKMVCARLERRQQAGRLKQWLNFMRRRYPQAELAYGELRTLSEPALIDQWFATQLGASRLHSANIAGQ